MSDLKLNHFKLNLLDPDKLIKVNSLQPVTNPVYFKSQGMPTDDGLLSNKIFGITLTERSNTFAYIDLGMYFLHPLIYKRWGRLDKRIVEIVHGTTKYKLNESGELIEDEHGKTGLKFLKQIAKNIHIKRTESSTRELDIKFLKDHADNLFIKQFIIIPAYYRDVNTDKGRVGVGEINELYDSLLIAVRALKESEDFGITMSDASRGRVQEILLNIYNWFGKEPNIPQKKGILRRANLSKTVDYASRLVMSAPNLRFESLEDIRVDLDHSAVPLSAACTCLFPFMVFAVRRFFENEFGGAGIYPYMNKKGEIKYAHVKDPLIEFSDDRIKKELERFVKGYANRFIPIKVPNEEGKNIYMRFKGRLTQASDINTPGKNRMVSTITNRKLTWCDVFFMAATEVSKDKVALITRYPIDTYFNQFFTKIVINSTTETEPMMVDTTFYSNYPKIREEDIGKNTSDLFIDTLNISNLHLDSIGGDYDGDQVTIRVAFTEEANQELKDHMNTKSTYINLGGQLAKKPTNEALQSLYSFTMHLPGTPLNKVKFKTVA